MLIGDNSQTIEKGTRGTVVAAYKPHYSCPYDVKFDGVRGLWPIKEDEII
jgi:hypothetical protein